MPDAEPGNARQVIWSVCAEVAQTGQGRTVDGVAASRDRRAARGVVSGVAPERGGGGRRRDVARVRAGSAGNLRDLHARVHSGAFRAKPSRRSYIAEGGRRLRPLGIAALEDKIVQRAVVEVLNAIYETDFLGFSYGFRPGRSPTTRWMRSRSGSCARRSTGCWTPTSATTSAALTKHGLMRLLEHRVADRRVLRLIQKWLAAGVLEDGSWTRRTGGRAAGSDDLAAARERLPALRL